MEVFKAALARFRNVEMPRLKSGPHSFEEAAKGAATHALRSAATEVALGIDGRWIEVAEIDFRGHWPCGITRAGELVIF